MTILIVEDDPGVTRLWERALAPIDAEVRSAITIPDALEQMRKIPPPDIVLLDLRLPGSSATNTLEHISELRKVNPKVLVVVLTGMNDHALPRMAEAMGADGFGTKWEIDTQRKLLGLVSDSLARRTVSRKPVFENSLEVLERLSALVTGS